VSSPLPHPQTVTRFPGESQLVFDQATVSAALFQKL
jgi:hypothetical protein